MDTLMSACTSAKLVARAVATGLYYNGTNFEAVSPKDALALRPGTSASDFGLSWAGAVEVLEVRPERESFAQRIASGELDKYSAAIVYVRERNHEGQKSFSIRTRTRDEYVSRVVKIEKTGMNRVAFVKYYGNDVVIVWSGGELAFE